MSGHPRTIHPALLGLACLILGWVSGLIHPVPLHLDTPSLRFGVGLSLMALAAGVFLWTHHVFQTHHTPIEPGSRPASMIVTGPYRISRNPMYIALSMTLAGFAAILDSLWMAAAIPLLVILLNGLVIPKEEKVLQEIFGEAYSAYAVKVRRWI
jgi:protein-S-isoprenylcysteine O-methyltransferase Ste14